VQVDSARGAAFFVLLVVFTGAVRSADIGAPPLTQLLFMSIRPGPDIS